MRTRHLPSPGGSAPTPDARLAPIIAANVTDTVRASGHRAGHRTWPLVPPAPLMVLVLGILLAGSFGVLGVTQLRRQDEVSASSHTQVVAQMLAARLAVLPADQHRDLLDRAARRTNTDIWLVNVDGLHDMSIEASFGPRAPEDLLAWTQRALATSITLKPELVTTRGTTIHAVVLRPLARPTAEERAPTPRDIHYLGVAVEIPDPPSGVRDLLLALGILTTLLIGVASTVALAVARDVHLDVTDLTRRIQEIAFRGRETTDRAQDVVPVQSLDEVGELAAAFNGLVERFAEAEKTYADALANIEELDQERAQFLATVSHELRSPLNAILGFADVLLSEVDGPLDPDAREEVAIIKQSGLHLLELINDILELSAIASGQLQLTLTEVDLVRVADEVVREAMGARGDKPVHLRVEARTEEVVIHADARRVRQIVTNLVGNALKFTAEGEVVVKIEPPPEEGRFAVIRVRDTGPGIPAQEREAIFEEYRQAGDARSRRRGTGLGLAIARRLAIMHGGTVTLESEIGRGSTFIVRLPESPKRSS